MKYFNFFFVSLIVASLFSCTTLSMKEDEFLFFKNNYVHLPEIGSITLHLQNDTLYKYRNKYSKKENKLESLFLSGKDRASLKRIVKNISRLQPFYGDLDYEFNYDWGLDAKISDKKIKLSVLGDSIPKELSPLYTFLMKMSENNSFKPVVMNSAFEEIELKYIIDRKKEVNKRYENERVSFLIWSKLVTTNMNTFYNVNNIDDFEYEVTFMYMMDSEKRVIEKIYLNNQNVVAIKLRGVSHYVAINMESTIGSSLSTIIKE